jgi:HD-GYP domain-containing protein (c-di-GMP phosphodiesterase class II)
MRRHLLPHAVAATVAVVVLPALVVLPLAPLDGVLDVFASAVLAIGLSVAAGSAGALLWERAPESKDTVFGDLMLWRWLRRELGERRVATSAERVADLGGDPLLPALQRLTDELERRDAYMRGHSDRVACHAERIARHMGLPDAEVERIRVAASIHDVGKLFVPHSILMRPGRLDPDEYALVKRHAEQGAELVEELGDPGVTAIVRHHHERIDGAGYPDGLAGDDIPLGSRIVAVADTFDAITSDRPYRRAASRKGALDVLSEVAGSQLDAAAVSAFVEYSSGRRSIASAAAAATVPQRVVSWIAATPAGVGASATPIAQGVCAAGAVAVAGICISGAPAFDGGRDGSEHARPAAKAGQVERTAETTGRRDVADDRRSSAGVRRVAGGSPGTRRDDAGGRGPATPGNRGGTPGQTGGRQPPATMPSTPRTGAGTVGRVVESPGSVAPDAPVSPPTVPLDPPKALDPVVDTVDKVLEPAPQPVKDLTEPVKDQLGQTGLTSPAP